jgi:hypothetical protein
VQVFSARVLNGAIVPDEGVQLSEGSRVTVIAGEADAPFELRADEDDALAESIAEADRGDVISSEELFRRLAR